MEENDYIRHGYKNRRDYLKSLADEHGIPFMVVNEIAEMLGENEDFDGLVTNLEDLSMSGEFDSGG